MNMKLITGIAAFMILSTAVSAQVVSPDSINALKQQTVDLKVSKDINEHKLKLAKLENSLQQKARDLQKANDDSQQSANDNADAAAKLSSNPNNKDLAKRADKTASLARKNSNRARDAAKDLDNLKKDIADEKRKISDDEKKLQPAVVETTQQ